jgi:GntR family transcriptional regulator
LETIFNQIQLDFRSDVPLYLQMMEQIQNLVLNGSLKPGDQLPTVRQLATELRVNFNTVARSYRLLDEAGLISTQRGRGTYIWDQPGAETSLHLRQQSMAELTRRYFSEAARLGFSPTEVEAALNHQLQDWKEEVSSPDFNETNKE